MFDIYKISFGVRLKCDGKTIEFLKISDEILLISFLFEYFLYASCKVRGLKNWRAKILFLLKYFINDLTSILYLVWKFATVAHNPFFDL